ncbi:LysR family transcriptional regulator [Rubellimicrobium roseum]|uniref:LysR family transcriptional regulator n=1 Tax=Rubellimicrobium roseum TaxID=687525 RepID=A0A5C4N7Q8_9RHOB|nr:LysR family transcriptional regulator [Rubellimicrobium roseum]TNC63734.1 LysR family transcriptional regulator [Rubellimicrobium roseum]
MNRLPLDALDAFAAIVRHGSFRRAATARGVSASTLSDGLRDLEARLGVRLLHRTTRSLALTEAGAALLDRLQPALGEIAAALDVARSTQAEPAGTLRINAPTPAIELVLAPLVADFLALHPAVRLEVTAETSLIDIVAKGFDAGVRWGEHLAQDMVAVPMGPPQRYVVAASPGLVDRLGAPREPADLLGLPCLQIRFDSGAEPPWEFARDGQVVRLSPPARLVSGNVALLIRAALDGVGFVATFDGYVDEHLASGRLVSVLDDWCETFPGPFLYYPSRRQPPSALRAFVDFLKARRREQGW